MPYYIYRSPSLFQLAYAEVEQGRDFAVKVPLQPQKILGSCSVRLLSGPETHIARFPAHSQSSLVCLLRESFAS